MYDGSLEHISDQLPVFLLGKEDEESHGERIRTSQDPSEHLQSQPRPMGKDCILPDRTDVTYRAA